MFASLRTVLRATSHKFGSFRRIPRSFNPGRSTRKTALTDSSVVLLTAAGAGVAGTIGIYKLTAGSIFDGESLNSYFANFLQPISPSFRHTIASCEVEKPTTLQDHLGELETRARSILEYCGQNDKDKIENMVKNMCKYLEQKSKGSGGTTETEKHLISDAIHGPIELSPLLYQIINTAEFHRLKDLRQLGGTHYVYPGANHTRFEHSIGVSYVARRFARSLKQQLDKDRSKAKEEHKSMYRFDEEEVLCAEIAGLCHDLGHGPFSHMFEKVMKEKLSVEVHHEDLSILVFKRMLANNPKLLAEFVSEGLTEGHVKLIEHMIDPPPIEERDKRLFLYEIVANKDTGIDVDKWDYYLRDCHYLGILQDFLWRRTMLLGRIVMTPDGYKGTNQLRIGFRDKEMINLYGMFRTRANIHQKACQHKTIKAVERMYIEAVGLVKDLQIIWVPSATDGGTFKSIEQAVELARKGDPNQLCWYLAMTDSIVGKIMSANACTEGQQQKLDEAKKLLKRVELRDLYTCSAKKRVPKFFHPLTFLRPDHPSNVYCRPCAKALDEDEDRKLVEDLYASVDKRHQFETLVHNNLLNEDKSIIERGDIWVDVVKIKHPSEKANNPIDEVLFYTKPITPEDLPKILTKDDTLRKASMVVVPQAFVEFELRVYDKRCKAMRKESHQRALQAAMEKAWKAWLDNNK